MTVTWHVNDLKNAHKDSLEVTTFINHFGIIQCHRRKVYRGKVHDYLGMDLNSSTANMLKIGMIKYMKKIHEDFPEEIKSAAAISAAEHIFNARKDNQDKILPEEKAQAFHHTPAQLLFLCTRPQPGIRKAVSFLCTRCKTPDEDNWGKLN